MVVRLDSSIDFLNLYVIISVGYHTRAAYTLARYVQRCSAISSRHGVPEPMLAIRAMRKHWGS